MRFLNIWVLLSMTTVAAIAAPTFTVYTKPKSNTFGVWNEETGFAAVWRRCGNLSVESNVAVVMRLPFRDSNGTQFTSGVTARYRFGATDDAIRPAVYTKIRHDLFHTFSQETGVSASLWHKDAWSLGLNAGVLYSYPLNIHAKRPGYTVGFTLAHQL